MLAIKTDCLFVRICVIIPSDKAKRYTLINDMGINSNVQIYHVSCVIIEVVELYVAIIIIIIFASTSP